MSFSLELDTLVYIQKKKIVIKSDLVAKLPTQTVSSKKQSYSAVNCQGIAPNKSRSTRDIEVVVA